MWHGILLFDRLCFSHIESRSVSLTDFFNSPHYLQSVPVHSADVVKSCTEACRRVLTSTLLYVIGPESSCDVGSKTYKLNLTNYIYICNNYISNLVCRSIGKFFFNRLARRLL
jgi:hypothetical protein